MKHMLDLFSGLGGASEAMVQSPGWSVLRIENNPLLGGVPFTIIDDVKLLANDLNPGGSSRSCLDKIDLIWASPPCTDFSGGFASPKSIASRTIGLDNYEPNMELLETAIEIIQKVKPKYWVIENVAGSIRYFKEYLGEPRQIIGPYVLWGNFPMIDLKAEMIIPKKYKDTNSRDPLRSNRRAKVDLLLSQRLKEAIEKQKSIIDF
jgi:hypothetical protein